MTRFFPAAMAVLLLSGCSLLPHPRYAAAPKPPAAPAIKAEAVPASPSYDVPGDATGRRIQLCRQELQAMQAYDVTAYARYKVRFDRVTSQLNKYLEIEDDISGDIHDIARPKYEFAIRMTCFDIKAALTRLIIKET